jgi:hypothetical protein
MARNRHDLPIGATCFSKRYGGILALPVNGISLDPDLAQDILKA